MLSNISQLLSMCLTHTQDALRRVMLPVPISLQP